MSRTLSTTFGNEPVWNSIIEVAAWVQWAANRSNSVGIGAPQQTAVELIALKPGVWQKTFVDAAVGARALSTNLYKSSK